MIVTGVDFQSEGPQYKIEMRDNTDQPTGPVFLYTIAMYSTGWMTQDAQLAIFDARMADIASDLLAAMAADHYVLSRAWLPDAVTTDYVVI